MYDGFSSTKWKAIKFRPVSMETFSFYMLLLTACIESFIVDSVSERFTFSKSMDILRNGFSLCELSVENFMNGSDSPLPITSIDNILIMNIR